MQHLEHLLLALEGLEQAAEGLPPPRLRLVGEVRDAADQDVAALAPAVAIAQHVGDDQQHIVLARGARRRQLQQLRLRVE